MSLFDRAPRRLEVLGCLVQGMENEEIAQALGIAVNTVEQHLRWIFHDLDVRNRTQAAVKAVRGGMFTDQSIYHLGACEASQHGLLVRDVSGSDLAVGELAHDDQTDRRARLSELSRVKTPNELCAIMNSQSYDYECTYYARGRLDGAENPSRQLHMCAEIVLDWKAHPRAASICAAFLEYESTC